MQTRCKSLIPPFPGVVLIVDDCEHTLFAYTLFLTQLGLECLSAQCALEARALFLKNSKSIRLVLTDGCLPDHDGLWLAREIRQISDGIPVVLVSGSVDRLLISERDRSLFVAVLEKPFAPEALRDVISFCLRPNSPEESRQGGH